MPSSSAASLKPDAPAFSWLDADLVPGVAGMLASPMPRGRGELEYGALPKAVGPLVDGRSHVVLVSYYGHPMLTKKALVLREAGFFVTLVGLCLRGDTEPERFFDQVHEPADYQALLDVLALLRPAALHALLTLTSLGALVAESARQLGIPFVAELNDAQFYVSRDPGDAACRLERAVLGQAAGVLHRMREADYAAMARAYQLCCPDLEHHNWPEDAFMHACSPYNGGGLSLVFAGGVMPAAKAKALGHEGHLFDPLIDAVAGAGHRLTFLVNQNARDMYWDEQSPYLERAARLPGFFFEKGQPYHRMGETLRCHHLGLYWENAAASSYNPLHFKVNMATKLQSYLEAGLPVLMPAHAEFMVDTVRAHGLGLIYEDFRHLLTLLDELTPIAHAELCANVRAWQKANALSAKVLVLVPFFRELTSSRAPTT